MNIECDIALRYLTQNRRKIIPNTCRAKIKVVLGDSLHTQPNITAFAVKGSVCKVLFQCHQALISSHNNRKMIYTILHKSFSVYIIYISIIRKQEYFDLLRISLHFLPDQESYTIGYFLLELNCF